MVNIEKIQGSINIMTNSGRICKELLVSINSHINWMRKRVKRKNLLQIYTKQLRP